MPDRFVDGSKLTAKPRLGSTRPTGRSSAQKSRREAAMPQQTSPLLSIGRLRARAPKTIAGFRRFRSVVESDGALPASLKRLFVAAAACTKGYEAMAVRELRQAAVLGLDVELAGSALAILSSSRGEGA